MLMLVASCQFKTLNFRGARTQIQLLDVNGHRADQLPAAARDIQSTAHETIIVQRFPSDNNQSTIQLSDERFSKNPNHG